MNPPPHTAVHRTLPNAQGMDSRVYFWPGSESSIRGVRPTEYHEYDGGVSFEERADVAAEWLMAAHKKRKAAELETGAGAGGTVPFSSSSSSSSFHAVYFEEPDAQGHKHGPHSKQVKEAVWRVDTALGRLREKIGDEAWNATNVVVVSDHGMAEVSTDRIIYLADDPCGVDFTKVAVSGGRIVMGLWGRSPDGKRPADAVTSGSGGGAAAENGNNNRQYDMDPAALANRIHKCHPNVSAWTRENVPERFNFKNNRRVPPVVVVADVGWTLCGHSTMFQPSSAWEDDGPDYSSDPLDWSLRYSACDKDLCPGGANTCGAHGYDNDAPDMRALFMARGPAFRKDGARLVGDLGGEGWARAVTGKAAREGVNGDLGGAKRWEEKTLSFDNVNVHAVVARAMGVDMRSHARLRDGNPPPRVDGAVSDALSGLLFDKTVSGLPPLSSSADGKDGKNAKKEEKEEEKSGEGEPAPKSGYALFSALLLFTLVGVGGGARMCHSRRRGGDVVVMSLPEWVTNLSLRGWWLGSSGGGHDGINGGTVGGIGGGAAYTQMEVELPDVTVEVGAGEEEEEEEEGRSEKVVETKERASTATAT